MVYEAVENFEKGKELANAGKYDESVKYFKKAISENPHYKEAYNELGKCLLILGKDDEAVKNFIFATMVDQDYVEAWANMEAAQLVRGKYDIALRCIDQILRIKPKDVDSYIRKAKLLYMLKRKDDACKALITAIDIDPSCKSRFGDEENEILKACRDVKKTEERSLTKKVCLLGDPGVGKTSLIRRFVYDTFDDKYLVTIGAKITKKTVKISRISDNVHTNLTMLIWDIAGQEKFSSVRNLYFQGTAGALLVCDITRKSSLDSLYTWMEKLNQIAGKVPVVCVINKYDLVADSNFDKSDVAAIQSKLKSPVFFTSAKTGRNVDEAFLGLGVEIVK